jgi:hypothetical protein
MQRDLTEIKELAAQLRRSHSEVGRSPAKSGRKPGKNHLIQRTELCDFGHG